MSKQEIRKQIKERISKMKAADRDSASLFVCLQIIGTAEWQGAETVLLYEAMPDEVDLGLLIQDARDSGKQLLMPQPSADAPALDPALLEKVDLAIIPGRAFTAQGDRMGRGKGYYDRLLPSLHCPKWGAAFSCQLLPEIPTDEWDVKLDKVFC
ncbi:MAG: 5-formyltetrahydrofolate cyclo-ligase [Bacteroidales bacterium]|nr:5-formyltetrahydrofolate cyclo-ligase [Bacteroidales bacterium]